MPERKQLHKLWMCIEEVRKIEEEMPAQRLSILLIIAMREGGITYKDLQDETGLANSTISRNISAMSKVNRHGKPGTNLVEAIQEDTGYRRKMLYLTPQGKRVVRSLLDHMEA